MRLRLDLVCFFLLNLGLGLITRTILVEKDSKPRLTVSQ